MGVYLLLFGPFPLQIEAHGRSALSSLCPVLPGGMLLFSRARKIYLIELELVRLVTECFCSPFFLQFGVNGIGV